MALCRVFGIDDRVEIVTYNDQEVVGHDGDVIETSADRLERARVRDLEVNQHHMGAPFIDIDPADLPSRESRDRWRLKNGKVVVVPIARGE